MEVNKPFSKKKIKYYIWAELESEEVSAQHYSMVAKIKDLGHY